MLKASRSRRRRLGDGAAAGRLVGRAARRCQAASRGEAAKPTQCKFADAGLRRRRRRSIRSTSCRTRRCSSSTARCAHLPWLQEMPDPMTSAMWSSWVEINPQTARTAGHRAGRLVDVTSSQGTLRAPALICPGHRARHGRDAGRAGARDVHALRERPRRRTRSRFWRRSSSRKPARWPGRRRACKIARVGDPDGD